MQWLPDEQIKSHEGRDDGDEDEEEHYYSEKEPDTPTPEPQIRVISLSVGHGEITGTMLSGEQLFSIADKEHTSLPLGTLLQEIADALQVEYRSLRVYKSEHVMCSEDVAGDVNLLVVKQEIEFDPNPVLLCKKNSIRWSARLGEGMPSSMYMKQMWETFDESQPIQALVEERNFVTQSEGKCWVVYKKKQVTVHSFDSDMLEPIGFFPPAPPWCLPLGARQWGGSKSDVWSASLQLDGVQSLLDEHAVLTDDRPIPRYQMVVDPNMFVREGQNESVWVPCEFDVSDIGSARLIGKDRSHMHPQLAEEVATPVLTAALPLLAKLRRPRLLLDDRRLQVVFKAQRIIVPRKVTDHSDSEYVGLWHVDGHQERVAAVVLYYYKVDPNLQGGDMEFCGREPMDVLGSGDCSNNNHMLNAATLRKALRENDDTIVTNCRVPISEGTLLVFSNYQMIHRVLRMVNTSSEAEASRDFVALFIIDPATKPLVPSRIHLAPSYLLSRTLRPRLNMTSSAIQNILEFAGELPSQDYAKQRRNAMLRQQLQPQGEFVGIGSVHATGNGCFTMIGWLDKMLGSEENTDDFFETCNPKGWDRFKALNLPPTQLNRGMSEVLSVSSSDLKGRGSWKSYARLECGDML